MGAIAGDLAAVEEIFALKDLLTRLGVANLDCRQDGAVLDPSWGRGTYLFNAGIAGIERADALLLVGSNPRREAAVLNARIRKRWRMGNFPIGLIGESANLTYSHQHLGTGPQTLVDIAAGRHEFSAALKKAKHPMVIIGMGALARPTARRLPRSPRRSRPAPAATVGTGTASCIRRHRAWVRSISVSFPVPAVLARRRWRRQARSIWFFF